MIVYGSVWKYMVVWKVYDSGGYFSVSRAQRTKLVCSFIYY